MVIGMQPRKKIKEPHLMIFKILGGLRGEIIITAKAKTRKTATSLIDLLDLPKPWKRNPTPSIKRTPNHGTSPKMKTKRLIMARSPRKISRRRCSIIKTTSSVWNLSKSKWPDLRPCANGSRKTPGVWRKPPTLSRPRSATTRSWRSLRSQISRSLMSTLIGFLC